MIFADALLARRLEAGEAAMARGTSVRPGSAVMDVAGGCAIFVGPESPLTHAVGVGLNGAVGAAEIEKMECFFRSRGAKVSVDVSPLADPSFVTGLSERGYRVTEFNNVLARRLAGYEPVAAPRARIAATGEDDVWSYTVGRGFFEHSELTEDEMDVGRTIVEMPGAFCYLAVAQDGQPAAGAAMVAHDGLAVLFADGTIAAYRREGFQRELIAARLNEAASRGCDLATASTLPGSGSQRNYERMGFQVMYTRLTLVG
jgi:GNAT superfamily N-acetyltransferase